jgi:RNA methyltransferase, TrmH family
MEKISNPHLKQISKLKQKKYRSLSDVVLVEGLRTIKHLTDRNIKLIELFISESHLNLQIDAEKTFILQPQQFQRITSTKNSQNIAALVARKKIPIQNFNFIVYLDNISEPGNLGTIIRTCEAAGASGLVLSPQCCDIYNSKVIRASMGSVFTFPVEYQDYDWLKNQKAKLIAAHVKGAINIYDYPKPREDIILIIGSEADGIDAEILNIVDDTVMIPLKNGIESLNAAVATAIAVYHFLN